jgi:hypothetical protein
VCVEEGIRKVEHGMGIAEQRMLAEHRMSRTENGDRTRNDRLLLQP